MAAIDDAINKLSPEEIDLLSSDPKMLSDFKAKYSQPESTPLSTYADVAGAGLSKIAGDVGKDVLGNIEGLGSTLKAGLYDVPKAIGALPGELAHGIATGSMPETELGKFTRQSTQGMAEGIKEVAQHPLQSAAEHPVSTAMLFSGIGAPEEAGVESGAKGFAETLSENADSRMAKINKALANVNENATKMGGAALPIPTDEEITQGTKNVINALKQVQDEHGQMLNDAKSSVGLPVTEEEKAASIRKYGNTRNLDLNKPLELPESMTQNAPDVGEQPLRNLKPDEVIKVKSTIQGMPDQELKYRGSQEDIDGVQHPLFDASEDIPKHGDDVPHPKGSTLTQETLEQHGYTIPSKIPDERFNPQPSDTMPYKISPTKSPEELNTEINRFMQNQDFISNKDKIKAASYYQDKINQQVNWDKTGSDVEGLLKSQYKDLKGIISDASPELQQAKTKFASLKQNLDLVSSGINPKEPGATQSYLRKLFTSTDPASKDKLAQLAYLEKLTGKPVVTNLFKQFAGKAFEPLVSRPGREVMEAAGGITSAAFGHPAGLVGAAGLLAAQSPRILGAVESGVSSLAKYGARFPLPASALSTLQSLRDRLNNQNNNEPTK